MKEKIQKESKAEYAGFILSEEGFRILQAAGYGGNMKDAKKTKVLMDLSDTSFERIKDSIKGMRLDFDLFTDKEKQRIKEIQDRKKIIGFET